MLRHAPLPTFCLLTIIAALAIPAVAAAENKPRLAVVFTSSDGIDKRLNRDLQETTLSALTQHEKRYTLVGREELTQLGKFPTHEALNTCLSEPHCTEVLKQDHAIHVLIQGYVERSGDSYLVYLRIQEPYRDPHTLTQSVAFNDGFDKLLETIYRTAAGLQFKQTSLPIPSPVIQPPKKPPAVTEQPTEPATQDKGWSTTSIVGYTFIGLSALSLGTGFYFDQRGDTTYDTLVTESKTGVSRERAEDLWGEIEGDATLSNSFYAGALGAGLVGAALIAYDWIGPENNAPTSTLRPILTPDTTGIALDTRF